MPVQIKISTAIKDTIITFFNDQQNQSFTFYVKGEPENFIFDPDNIILDDAFINDPRDLTIPENFELGQNFPNPFNSSTSIIFQAKKRSKVTIKVFDLLGNEAAVIFNKEVEAGKYSISFDASSLASGVSAKGGYASGVYFYRMLAVDTEPSSTQNFVETKKMILLK